MSVNRAGSGSGLGVGGLYLRGACAFGINVAEATPAVTKTATGCATASFTSGLLEALGFQNYLLPELAPA